MKIPNLKRLWTHMFHSRAHEHEWSALNVHGLLVATHQTCTCGVTRHKECRVHRGRPEGSCHNILEYRWVYSDGQSTPWSIVLTETLKNLPQ